VSDRPVWTRRSIAWLLGIAVAAGGLACCVTLLNRAGRVIMGLGGFVARGGPYVIAQPAPDWVLIVPGSILAGFAFGGTSVALSSRMGGFSLVPVVWSGLFLSLGAQFAIMGLNPPGGAGIAWGWILCAVVFIPMGLAPLFGFGNLLAAEPWAAPTPKPCDDPAYREVYLACVVVGGLAGVIAGVVLFSALAG
jgi:hypothetical protein